MLIIQEYRSVIHAQPNVISFMLNDIIILNFKNSPFYKGSELWKLLPIDIVSMDSIFQFKQALKRRYTRNLYYYLLNFLFTMIYLLCISLEDQGNPDVIDSQ